METIGRFTVGIARDFNHLLTGVGVRAANIIGKPLPLPIPAFAAKIRSMGF